MLSDDLIRYWPIALGVLLIVLALLVLVVIRRGQRVSLDRGDAAVTPRPTLVRGATPAADPSSGERGDGLRLVPPTRPVPSHSLSTMPHVDGARPRPNPPKLSEEQRIAEATAGGIDPVLVTLPRPTGPGDNLLLIKGLGPRLAILLNGLGIERFDQIAALSDEQVAAIDRHLGPFAGRFDRDRWIEQAGFLARGDTAGFEAAFGAITPTTGT